MTGQGRCPYHQMAQAGDQTSLGLFAVANHIERLKEGIEALLSYSIDMRDQSASLPYKKLSATSAYVGHITHHASFHNQGMHFPEGNMPIASGKHTVIGRMFGEAHAQYRKTAAQIGGLLDIKSLSLEAQASIKHYLAVKKAYSDAVLKTGCAAEGILPDFRLLSSKRREQFSDQILDAVDRLMLSELTTMPSVPIAIANDTVWVQDKSVENQPLGLYLFCLKQASIAQVDMNKMPYTGANSFEQQIGTQSAISRVWQDITQEPLKIEIERITRYSLQALREHLGKEPEALQTANLMMALVRNATAEHASEELCRFAGISPELKQLSNSMQAAAIAEALVLDIERCAFHASVKPKLLELARQWQHGIQPTFAELQAVSTAVTGMERDPAYRERGPVMQACALIKDFMRRERCPDHERIAVHEYTSRGH